MIKDKRTCFFLLIVCLLQVGMTAHAEEKNGLLQYLAAVAQGGPIYEVAVDGTGDFTSIQEAVEQVESGATLLIYPGVYEECVEIINKTVNLIGTSKEECILISDTKDYHHIPLTVAAGTVYNMTICGSNPTKENIVPFVAKDYDVTDLSSIYNWQSQFSGYTIHIDQDYAYGRELLIEKCRIISDSNYCVGIGCRGLSTITFADCEFFSNSNGGGCIFLHNTQAPHCDGEAYFIMRDCELRNYLSPYVISVQSTGGINPAYLTFQNVKVSTIVYETKNLYDDNMNTWYNLNQLKDPKIRKLLADSGYYTTLKDDLIQNLSCEAWQTMQLNRSREALLGNWPDFGEGIHYVEIGDRNEQNTETTLKGARGGRYVVNISNLTSESPKDGWCGLYNIYLTQQSFGNTLIEMNYPIMVSSEKIECVDCQ